MDSNLKKEWYVVNTYAGQENRVKENLERRIKTMGLEDSLFQVVVAEEKVTEYKNNKKVEKTHNLFSGYVARANDHDRRGVVRRAKHARRDRIYRIQRKGRQAVPCFAGRN